VARGTVLRFVRHLSRFVQEVVEALATRQRAQRPEHEPATGDGRILAIDRKLGVARANTIDDSVSGAVENFPIDADPAVQTGGHLGAVELSHRAAQNEVGTVAFVPVEDQALGAHRRETRLAQRLEDVHPILRLGDPDLVGFHP